MGEDFPDSGGSLRSLPGLPETNAMLFASLALDREPLHWVDLPAALMLWGQNAGGVAVLGLMVWLATRTLQREPILMLSPATPPARRALLTNLFLGGAIVGIAGYLFVLSLAVGRLLGFASLGRWFPRGNAEQQLTLGDYCLTVSGWCAILLVTAPIFASAATRMRVGRIWAIARLSLKEAVRGRVVWVFGAIALIFLFIDWFVPYKAEDQVRNYVRVVYWSMTPLFLLTAGLLGSFSIPTDVKNNSIHTIVTKPVEKFEIVLGRFLGYGILLTVGVFAIALLSLGYVIRGVNEEARQESYKARVVLYGNLHFAGTKNEMRADSVGREWSYRSYITGPTYRARDAFRQYAIWDFAEVPADLGKRDKPIRFEFAFDIFRMSKGEEGKGVYVTFTFAEGVRQAQEIDVLAAQMKEERDKLGGKDAASTDRALLAKYRIHQVSKEVTDYHTQFVEVPSNVFEVLLSENDARKAAGISTPALRVFLNVNIAKEAQMLGVAKPDFYMLAHERLFEVNFLKGIAGMWCTHMLVLGIAVACSTYLSSVISLLCTLFLFCAGMSGDYMSEIAENRLDGGGVTESLVRLTKQMPIAQRLEASPTTSVIQSVDSFFGWWVGRLMNLIPDINRYDLHKYVANGFDIGWTDVLFLDNLLPLLAHLIPWAIAAYYLMQYREIANPS